MRPRCFGTSGSVRATSMPNRATCASVVQTFCPETIHSSPSRTALVASPATSDPAPGSLNSWHQISSHGEERPQVALSLLGRPVGLDGRCAHPVSDGVALRLVRSSRFGERSLDHELERRVDSEATVTRREPDPRQARVEARPQEIDRLGRLRVVVAEQRFELPGHDVHLVRFWDRRSFPGSP